MSGEGILAGVARGDSSAMSRALEVFGPLVWSIARTYCVRHHDAEEAAQEAFVKLWRMASRYDPSRGSETAFVVAVARSRVLDYRRSKQCEAPAVDVDDGRQGDTKIGSARSAGDDQLRAAAALSQLPAEQQEALRLTVQRGLTQESAAQALGVPLGTVKTRVRSGLMRLRDAMAGGGA